MFEALPDPAGIDELEPAGIEDADEPPGWLAVASHAQIALAAEITPSALPTPQALITQFAAAPWIALDEAGIHWQDKSVGLVQPAADAADSMQEVAQGSTLLVKERHGSLPPAGALVMADVVMAAEEVIIFVDVVVAGGAIEVDIDIELVASGVRVASQAQIELAALITAPAMPIPQEDITQFAALPWIAFEEADEHWQARSAVSVQPTADAALTIQPDCVSLLVELHCNCVR